MKIITMPTTAKQWLANGLLFNLSFSLVLFIMYQFSWGQLTVIALAWYFGWTFYFFYRSYIQFLVDKEITEKEYHN